MKELRPACWATIYWTTEVFEASGVLTLPCSCSPQCFQISLLAEQLDLMSIFKKFTPQMPICLQITGHSLQCMAVFLTFAKLFLCVPVSMPLFLLVQPLLQSLPLPFALYPLVLSPSPAPDFSRYLVSGSAHRGYWISATCPKYY